MPIAERLFVALQHLLPKRLISRLVGALCRLEAGAATRVAIARFIRHYRVDMREAAAPDPLAYASFNAFFTRPLRDGARPQPADPLALASPADGCISECGPIEDGLLLQVKGLPYALDELFDGDRALAQMFHGGSFATIYLAPYNYHRVHMPLAGQPRLLRHVPGSLYAVNAVTARRVPRLFVRNERVIVVCGTGAQSFAVIMVGALNVGSIELSFLADRVLRNRPLRGLEPHVTVALDAPQLARGAEFGRFNMGSTVIVAAAAGLLDWETTAVAGRAVRTGEPLARLRIAAARADDERD